MDGLPENEMASFDLTGLPRCTIDFSLDIHPEEIETLTGAVNTLLKSSYLLGTSLEIEPTFQSLFDIAEEIAGVESCGFLVRPDDRGPWGGRYSRKLGCSPSPEPLTLLRSSPALGVPLHNPLLLDSENEPAFQPICAAWSSRSLAAFP